jgi:hypothetical protein
MPPISCTSKWRMPSTRLAASRTVGEGFAMLAVVVMIGAAAAGGLFMVTTKKDVSSETVANAVQAEAPAAGESAKEAPQEKHSRLKQRLPLWKRQRQKRPPQNP